MSKVKISDAMALYNARAGVTVRDGYEFVRASTADSTYFLKIEGYIWGASSTFQDALALVDSEDATHRIRINSGGGSVTEGWAIFDSLSNAKGKTIGEIYGICASAASFAILGCDEVYISENARFMIHEAQAGADGTSEELRETAEIIDILNDQMAEAYATKTGKTKEEIRAMMKDETWFRGQEAVDAGFCDGLITKGSNARACVEPETLMAFKNTPKELIEMAQEPKAEDKTEVKTPETPETAQAPAADPAPAETPAVAPVSEPAPAQASVDVEEIKRVTSIEAACAMFKQPEKAKGFIDAKASLDDVRKALWNAHADATDAKAIDGTNTAPVSAPETQEKSLSAALNEIRALQFARPKTKS